MSLLIKAQLISKTSKVNPLTYQVVRNYWNKDFKPDKYPRTKAEREAAAKKYGLLPSEYEAYPDDGLGYGDYPKLPTRSSEGKSPHYAWDFPEHRRNFGEPMHVDIDNMGEDRFDASIKMRFKFWQYFLSCTGTIAASYGLYFLFSNYRVNHPLLAKQYPKDGVSYTFEPAE